MVGDSLRTALLAASFSILPALNFVNIDRDIGLQINRKEVLKELGFNFNYFTSLYITKEGNQYLFCYDMGVLQLDDAKVRIVEYQSYMKK